MLKKINISKNNYSVRNESHEKNIINILRYFRNNLIIF